MRNDKLIPGAILVIIGALFLLDNFHVINFNWFSILHLWPILLIIGGVNLLFVNHHSPTATIVKVGVLIIGMAFLIYSGIGRHGYNNGWTYDNHHFYFHDRNDRDTSDNNDRDDDDESDSSSISKTENHGVYTEGYKPGIQFARLNINGGGTSYTLKDVTNQLFEAETKGGFHDYTLKTSGDSTNEVVNFNMGGDRHHGFIFNFDGKDSNKAFLKLNTNPEWEINVKAGATALNFDLSNYKIRDLKLEGGAGSFHIKMGQPLNKTNVNIKTGMSELVLNVPQNAACRIISSTGLSSKSFSGFQSKGDNQYETPDFDKAPNKMYIRIGGGLSDIKVQQY